MDFFWADQYDVMAGPNRKSRRLMEEENKKLRKKAKREYNETVRGLAEFVKKRDKRVIDMQIKRNEEIERKKEEEKQRKKELERQKAEMARNYEEQEWAKVDEMEDDDEAEDMEERKNELYCVVCRKKFKSDKQWKNHEQSKKHKEKVAELREAFSEEDKEFETSQRNEKDTEDENDVDGDNASYLSVDDGVNELQEEFEAAVGLHEDDSGDEKTESSEANEFVYFDKYDRQKQQVEADLGSDDDDDEASILEAMLSRRKNRTKGGKQPNALAKKLQPEVESAKKCQPEVESDESETMKYNDMKGLRRNKAGRRRRARRQVDDAEPTKAGVAKINDEAEGHDESYNDVAESSSHPLPDSEANTKADDAENSHKYPQKSVNKKYSTKEEYASKSKIASKGRKQKEAANGSSNTCEKCGEQFESKNKLHKHLGETGHASLKSR